MRASSDHYGYRFGCTSFQSNWSARIDDFGKLVDHKSSIESIPFDKFDPKNQYSKVVDAVKKAGSSDVSVFRADHGSTRAEYYIVSVDSKEGRIVGFKALAVES